MLVNYRSVQDVASRLASDALRDADVVVVDNASDPEQVRALCDSHGATAVLLPDNRGFAAGVNAGWAAVRERPPLPLLLLNPDAQLSRAALDLLLQALPGRDGVGPVLLEEPDRPQVGVGGGPVTLWSVVAYFLLLSHVAPFLRGIFLTRRQARVGGPVAWVCMAALLLAPDALDRHGLLPEDELVYAEDIAWGTAASRHGASFAIVSDAVVPHVHGSSGESDRWVGAIERLLLRRLGRLRGSIAVAVVRVGLFGRATARAVLSRSVEEA